MKTEKSKNLRGSVLLTVVSVMSLLIIFLSGTLVLASAANNRAHINYSSAQAGITSRAVADAALKAISDEAHPEYANAILSLDSSSAPIKVPVSISSSSSNTGSFGNIQDVTVEYAGTKEYYNEDTKAWEEKDLLKFTSNVTLGGVTSTTTSYVVKDPPIPSGGGGGGAGFVTTGGASFDCQTNLYGGSYINLPTLADATTYNYAYDGPQNYLTGDDLGFVNSGSSAEADTMFNGNLNLGNVSAMNFPGKGKGITVWGDANFGNGDHLTLYSNLTDDQFDSSNPIDFNEIPYIYIDGAIKTSNKIMFKPASDSDIFPLNIFCGYVDVPSGNGFEMCGDIYCLNPDKTSVIGSNGSKLYGWSASVMNKVDSSVMSETGGSFYSMGSLKVQGNGYEIGGDCRINGDLEVTSGTLNISGDLVVGGKIIMNGGSIRCAGLYCDNIIGSSVNNIYVNGVQVISGERPVKEGYTSVDNKHIDVSTDPITTVNNIQYEYELQNVDMGGWSKNMYVDKFGNRYDTWANPGTYYYEEVDIDGTPLGVKADGEFTYFDGNGTKLDPSGYLEVNSDGSLVDPSVYTPEQKSYFDDMGNRVSESDMYDGGLTGVSSIADYGDDVYPEYAERDVILGLETIDGHTKDDTQVVMTMKDVLENVINPYESSALPSIVQTAYTNLMNDGNPIYHNVNDIKADVGESVKRIHDPSTGKVKVITEAGSSGAPVVNKSCILDLDTGNGGEVDCEDGKKIVFDPGPNNIVVVVRKFGTGAGVDVVVDDSEGGKVYFYLENDANFSLGGGPFVTTKYLQLFEDNTDFQVYTDASYARRAGSLEDPKSIQALGLTNPGVYIYGGTNTSINFSNFQIMTANIVSPNVSVTIAATSNNVLSDNNIYYDGFQVNSGRNYIIGCVNSKTTSFPNMINMIYVPDNMSTPPPAPTPDLSHWFKVLYYDEY